MSLVSIPASPTVTGVIIEVNPITAIKLKILDPIRFPIEMAFSLLITAMIEADNSGILVPIDTTVILITRSLTPKLLASEIAPFTRVSEPNHSPNPPRTR